MAKRRKAAQVAIVVLKGNKDVQANSLKMNAVSVVMRFVARVAGTCHLMEDEVCMLMVMDAEEGDTAWVMNNVFRYVDVLGATTDEQIDRKVDQAIARFEEVGGTPDKVGTGCIIRHLDQYYLMQRSASVFGLDGVMG